MSIIQELLKTKFGFVDESNIKEVIKENPQQLMLVRCGQGRFICAADSTDHFVSIIVESGKDYIRDISIYNVIQI